MLRFLLDQNLSPQTTLFLRRLGYDVTDVREQNLAGATDDELLSVARRDSRIILTFDSDFADIRAFPAGAHPGIIRLKIIPQTIEILHPILEKHLANLQRQNIDGCLVIIDNWKVRIKRK